MSERTDAVRSRAAIIQAARCSAFFVDDAQRVTLSDIGHSGEIERWARALGAGITRLELPSQFRCAGSDGYVAWLDALLGIRETANVDFDHGAFAFAYAQGRTWPECMRFATVVAAVKCTKLGGRTGIPDLKTTEKLLRKQ